MKYVKICLAILGVLMVVMGSLWIGQGLNIIKWPETSMMIGARQWSWNGMFLATAGVAIIWWSRRN